ncbi:MAG: alpha-L-fucosidase [Bacteroidales bacterium]|nr:alpha-L-fucosidase [Bacteroidales bacterium]
MKRLILSAMLVAALSLSAQPSKSKQVPTWDKLNARPYPQWFSDAKLGIFIHWGLYSVPAFAGTEGYGEWLYKGLLSDNGPRKRIMSLYADTTLPVHEMYGQLTDHWHAELWQPSEWAALFKKSGARYVMLVTKHHDGYSLWDDPFQPQWNSVVSGPRRDIVRELTDAVRAEGLRMCFYYSLPEWSNPLHRWTVDPDTAIGRYVDEYMVPQFVSLVSAYLPDAIFADGDWDFTPEQFHSISLIDWYYRTVGPDAIVNDRWGRGTRHGFRTPEYSAGISDTSRPWAECRGIGRSFGLNRNERLENYLTDRELIQHFCELVAHGGGLTLNIGPAADGHIPFIQQERLLALGRWLDVNGEAIYASRACAVPCHRESSFAPMPPCRHIDFDWVRNAPLKNMPVDNFSIEWVGEVQVAADGEYTLRVEGNDEATVFLGDSATPLLHYNSAWADNAGAQASVRLSAGSHRVVVRYVEKDLEAIVRLLWSRDGGLSFEPVPAGWRGTASWQRTTRCFTRRDGNLYVIEFERPGSLLELPGMPRLPKGTVVTMLGTSTPLKWRQGRDGSLRIDLNAIPRHELNELDHAWVLKFEGAASAAMPEAGE